MIAGGVVVSAEGMDLWGMGPHAGGREGGVFAFGEEGGEGGFALGVGGRVAVDGGGMGFLLAGEGEGGGRGGGWGGGGEGGFAGVRGGRGGGGGVGGGGVGGGEQVGGAGGGGGGDGVDVLDRGGVRMCCICWIEIGW